MKTHPLTRRHFLQGLGQATLALPFLPSLFDSDVWAQTSTTSPRLIVFFVDQGSLFEENFWPSVPNGSGGFNHNLTMQTSQLFPNHTIHYETIQTLMARYSGQLQGGGLSPVLGSWLSPYWSKLNVIRGLDYLVYKGHNEGGVLGNFVGGPNGGSNPRNPQNPADLFDGMSVMPTIDQILAYSSKIYPSAAGQSRCLSINPSGGSSFTFNYATPTSTSGMIQRVSTIGNPTTLFNNLFSTVNSSQSQIDKSIVDQVYNDYIQLRGNSKLSQEDRLQLDRHIAYFDQLSQNLASSSSGGACNSSYNLDLSSSATASDTQLKTLKNFNSVIAGAIMCGKTRIATVRIDEAFGYDSGDTWHFNLAHNANAAQGTLVQLNQWVVRDVFVDLLQKLDVPEANGKTYLDNSIVLLVNECSTTHSNFSMPVIMAGGAGGQIQTGMYIDYRNRQDPTHFYGQKGGLAYNRLLVTILQSMGLSPADYERTTIQGTRIPGYGFINASNGSTAWRGYRYGTVGGLPRYNESQVDQPLPLL